MADASRSWGVEPLPQFRATDLAALHAELGIPANYASTRGLVYFADAAIVDLMVISASEAVRKIQLIRPAADAWRQMRAAAFTSDITLLPLSGFRSITRQAEIIRAKLAAGDVIADILRMNTAPGYSEHHTGRALDLGTTDNPPFEQGFSDTAAFQWLRSHATAHGFFLSYPRGNSHGIVYEPWHWCWRE